MWFVVSLYTLVCVEILSRGNDSKKMGYGIVVRDAEEDGWKEWGLNQEEMKSRRCELCLRRAAWLAMCSSKQFQQTGCY